MLSKRISNIEESGIRKVFNLAAQSQGDFVNLSIGQPHFKTPNKIKRAAMRAIKNDKNAYTPTLGIPELRKKIAEKLQKENNIKADQADVIVTAGVSGSIFLALSALLDPGDEAIITDPYFVSYKQIISFLGAKAIILDTYPDFQIKAENLARLVTPKTKVIILNSPSNPTGAVCAQTELEKIAGVARENNLIIISDEIYEKFDYENKFFSIGSIYENTVTLNGFSKTHSVAGWRIGYAHGPREIIDAMNKLQQYTFVCASSFAQIAIAEEFDADMKAEYKRYKKKRNYVYKNLKDKYEMSLPQGAFYAFIKKPVGRPNFVEELSRAGLLVVSGGAFSERDTHFRLSFAASDEDLVKGIEILKGAV